MRTCTCLSRVMQSYIKSPLSSSNNNFAAGVNTWYPYYQEQDVVPFIQDKGIAVQCWYPLGGRGYTSELLGDETIKSIAEAHGVSSAQVILRWDLQRGIVVIPGSGNPDHIKENLDLFGFELTEDEMEQISLLDRGEKHDWYWKYKICNYKARKAISAKKDLREQSRMHIYRTIGNLLKMTLESCVKNVIS